MQSQGTLQEANLASLLQAAQSERATGTLTIENGPTSCSLYFLFGHLFHASDASRQGEDVVVDALTWNQGSFQFDPRAKLPAEETIKASPADLIAEAEQRGGASATAEAPAADAGWAATPTDAAAYTPPTDPPAYAAPTDAPSYAPPTEAPAWGVAPAEATDATPTDTTAQPTWGGDAGGWGAPAETPAPAPEAAPADTGYSWAPQADAAEAAADSTQPTDDGAPADAGAPAATETGYSWGAPAEQPTDTGAYSWGQTQATEPEPGADAAAPEATTAWSAEPSAEPVADVASEAPAETPADDTMSTATVATPAEPVAATAPAEPLAVLYPLPAGKTTYEGLKSSFVDFPKLLRTLRNDGHTGYVHLEGDGFSGTLVFQAGTLIEALADAAGQVSQGENAFQLFRRNMDEGAGHLDVVDLSDDLVAALGQLFAAPQMFHGLLGRFVNFDALVEYLEEEAITGSVVITNSTEMGVILLHGGQVLGAYTESNRTPDTKLTAVSTLAKETSAHIEVRSGAGAVGGIDIEAQLAQPL